MGCFLIARYTVKDEAKTAQYSALAAPTMAAFGAEIAYRGKHRVDLAGEEKFEHAVIAAFASRAQAERWYNSPEYQQLIALRDQGVDIVIALYE